MTQNKNQLFGRHFETVQHFFRISIFFIVHTCMVQISLQKSGGKVVFLAPPPWALMGVKVPWSLKC